VINVKNHFLFDVRNSWFSSGRKRVKGLAVRNELLSSRSTGPRTISTGWDKITRKWWIGFNVSTNRVDNTKNPDKFLQYKSPHFLPFLFLVPRNISHPQLIMMTDQVITDFQRWFLLEILKEIRNSLWLITCRQWNTNKLYMNYR
jgi:hypothetical protein